MKIAVVGAAGVVGKAISDGFERLGHEVFRHDLVYSTSLNDTLSSDVIFVCVPTPSREDGSCDTSIVEEVVKELATSKYMGIIAIKSTVEPGTTSALWNKYSSYYTLRQQLKLCFVPEFLRERSAFSDFVENHDICVVGLVNTKNSKYIYEMIKVAHGHYPAKFHMMKSEEAELLKYFSNVFNALRVVWANAFYDVCKKMGADYTKIKNAVVDRGTVTDMYLDCNEKWRGFAGPCLPKESAALAEFAERLGVDAQIFRTIVEDNKLYTPTVPEGMRL